MESRVFMERLRTQKIYLLTTAVSGLTSFLISASRICPLLPEMSWEGWLDLYTLPAALLSAVLAAGILAYWLSKKEGKFFKIPNNLLIEILLMLLSMALLNVHYYFRNIDDIGIRSVPVITFLAVLFLGWSAFIVICRWNDVKTEFAGAKEYLHKHRLTLLWTVGILLFSSLIKCILYLRNAHYVFTLDEKIYFLNSKAIFYGRIFNGELLNTHYPPLYPLFLTPAFLAGTNTLRNMQILNAIYSSFAAVLTYFFLRLYLDQKTSIIGAFISTLLPYHFYFPRTLFSENIFVPLLMFTVYTIINSSEISYKRTFQFGILLSALFLTRYISLVVLPILILFWLLRTMKENSYSGLFRHLMVLISVVVFLYGLWIFYGVMNGDSFKDMLGFQIVKRTHPEQLTVDRFFYFCLKTVFFSVLLCGPFIFPLLINFWNNFPGKIFSRLNLAHLVRFYHSISKKSQLLLVFSGLTASFWVAIVRHHWRAKYNYPEVSKFSSRYFAFLVPLVFILAWYGVEELIKKPIKRRDLLVYLAAAGCLALSYVLVFNGYFTRFPFRPEMIPELTFLDITLYMKDYRLWYVAVLMLLPGTLFLKKDRLKVIFKTLIVVHMIFLVTVSYHNLDDRRPAGDIVEWQINEFGEVSP